MLVATVAVCLHVNSKLASNTIFGKWNFEV